VLTSKKKLEECLLLCGNCHNTEHQRLDEKAQKATVKNTTDILQ